MKIVLYTKNAQVTNSLVTGVIPQVSYDVTTKVISDEHVNNFVEEKLKSGFTCAIFELTDIVSNKVSQQWLNVKGTENGLLYSN